MPNLPPPVWAELFYSGAWNTVTDDVRVTTSAVTITRGLSSESASEAAPTSCSCDLDSRDYKYAPRNPNSELSGLIGRNTPMRVGYTVGSPWGELPGGLTYNSLFVNDNPALDVTGDFDLRLDVALEDWSESQMLALRNITGGNGSWVLEILDGILTFLWYPDGTFANRIDQAATEAVKAYNGQRMALRVTLDIDNGAGGYELRFYTGRTVDDEEWHLLGAPIVGGSTTAVFAGSAYMEIGAGTSFNATPAGGLLNRMRGKAYALKLLDSGTVKVDMSTSAAVAGGTTFTDSTGLLWSRGGGAVLTNKHIRMAGEVPAWPPTRDLSGNDNYVSINPSGVTRRMDAGNKPQDSALLRYIKANNPIACWPMTDGPASPSFKSLTGGSDMQQEILVGTDTAVEKAAGRLADWVEPVISAKANTTAFVSAGTPRTTGTDAFWSFDIFLSGGGPLSTGTFTFKDRGAGTDADNRIELQVIMTGSLDRLSVIRASYGTDTSSLALLSNIDGVGIYDNEPHHIRLSIDPQASSTLWYVYVDGVLAGSGTIASIVVKSLRSVRLGWGFASGNGMTDRAFGYFTYWDGNGPTAAQMWDAYTGFQGEKAGDRIVRLATESGYTATVAGESVFQRPLGIQGQKKLLELMNDASRTNFGYLLDARDRTEVIHRGQSTLWNQPPALTLDFEAGLISPPFKPVDDDKLTENDVSVKREYGSDAAREVLEEGALSVLDPELGGVGRYDRAHTYSLETDDQARQVAGMRLHLGTYDGVRYTRLTLNLANERVFAMIDDILRIDVGDKIRLTDLPADHGPDDVDVLVAGYTEEAGPDAWLITFNCVPGEPWTAGVVGSGTYGHVDTDGSELAAAVDTDDVLLSVAGPLWTPDPTDTPFDIRAGGEVMTVTTVGQVLNSNPFFQAGLSGWSAQNSTISHSTAQVHPDAVASMLITPNGVSSFGGATTTTGAASITPAAQYVASMWVYSTAGIDQVQPLVDWFNNVGGYISSSTTPGGFIIPAAQWTHIKATYTAPAGASQAILAVRHEGTPAASEAYYVWAVRIVPVSTYNTSPQTFTVDRSINGVQKAHPSGQDIRLAHPVYVPM